MHRMLRVCLILLTAHLALAGCTGESVVDVDQQRAAETNALLSETNTVPLHMKVRNTIELVPPFPPPIINAIFEGTGKSRPFGPFTLFSTSQIDITVFPFNQVAQYVFTFQNGDELHANSVGIGIEDPPGIATFSGAITFAGGTGHFSNATGSGTYTGSADTAAGVGQFDIDGTITGFGGPGN